MSMQDLAGRTAVVTGGSTGIGRATVLLLSELGVRVLTNARSDEHLGEAQADFARTTTPVETVLADLGSQEGVEALFDRADALFPHLDMLVCNAAIPAGSAVETDYAGMAEVVDTNLLGYLACSHEAVNRMRANGGGQLVLVGSMSADVREPSGSVYVATKAGIQGFAESLRQQVNEDGIRVTLVQPGAVGTDMQPDPETHAQQAEDQEMLLAEDVAQAVQFCLAQPARCDIVRLDLRPHRQMI
jgi:NAD(P)-dependent dehydrogenase (short-subunit alcohol dehydrogenase family)